MVSNFLRMITRGDFNILLVVIFFIFLIYLCYQASKKNRNIHIISCFYSVILILLGTTAFLYLFKSDCFPVFKHGSSGYEMSMFYSGYSIALFPLMLSLIFAILLSLIPGIVYLISYKLNNRGIPDEKA